MSEQPTNGKKKTIDIIEQKDIGKSVGVFVGIDCVVPSKRLTEMFCDGFNQGIENAVKLASLNQDDYLYLCQVKPKPSNITAESLELSDSPIIQEALTDHDVIISKFDKKLGSSIEIKKFKSTRQEGKITENEECKISKSLLAEKFCNGYKQGANMVMEESKVKKELYKHNCKKDMNEEDDNEDNDKIIYGSLRVLE